jgi:transmembrane sensor
VKDYTLFSAKEFAVDDFFQSWVYNPTDKTNSFWQAWLEEHPHKADDVEEARAILLQLTFTHYNLSREEVSSLWNEIKKVKNASRPQKSQTVRRFWYSAAAAIFVGVASVFWMNEEKEISYETAFGETKTITLPDSSTVILNSNSKLTLASDWPSKGTREVRLDGEAFFSVIHKINNQPFKVTTSQDFAIEVLGTTFNVYHRKDTKVVLNSGSIQLSLPSVQPSEKVFMKPGDLVEYDKKKYTKRRVDPKLYTSWTQRNLVLNHTSLRELIQMMKDNYGIEVEVRKNLLDETISGSMPVTNAENLLEQIAISFRLKLLKENNKIYMME